MGEESIKESINEGFGGIKRMSKRKLIFRGLLIFIAIVIAVQFFNAARYDAVVQVIEDDRLGVNPTGERLDFGDLPRDKDAVRIVTLANNSPYKVSSFVMVWKYGEIQDFMDISRNNFALAPGETEKLEFRVHIPNSAEFKNYRGKVIIFQIPKIW